MMSYDLKNLNSDSTKQHQCQTTLSQSCEKMQMFNVYREAKCVIFGSQIITFMYIFRYFYLRVQPTMFHMLILVEVDLGEHHTEIAPLPSVFHISTSFHSFLYLASFPISSVK